MDLARKFENKMNERCFENIRLRNGDIMKKIFVIAVLSLSSNAFSAPMIVEHETCMLNLEKSESLSASTTDFLQHNGFKMGFAWQEDLAIRMITHEIQHHEFPKSF